MSNYDFEPIGIRGRLQPATSDAVLTESQYIKNGYIVVQTVAERDALLDTSIYADRLDTLSDGQPVYVAEQNKTYRLSYNGSTETWSFIEDKELEDLQTRIESLESKTTRLLYDVKTDPTPTDIRNFVIAQGYGDDPNQWGGIAVVVYGTYHIWHYYAGDVNNWVDDGVDTVKDFTNTYAGIIKGSSINGYISAEVDIASGYSVGKLNGYEGLVGSISNIQNALGNKVDKTTTIAGISLQNNISASDLMSTLFTVTKINL